MRFPYFANWIREQRFRLSGRKSGKSFRRGKQTGALNHVEALEQRLLLAQNVAPGLNNSGSPYLISPVGHRMAVESYNGILVTDLLARGASGRPITDPDAGAAQGIALTAIDKSLGTWQYSLVANPQASDWTKVDAAGAISNSSALLLPADDNTRLRFVTTLLPSHGGDGYLLVGSKLDTGLTFRAWDRTTGTAGGRANTSSNGGSTAFSSATETAATYFETRLFRSFNPNAKLNVYTLEPEFDVLTKTLGYEDRSTLAYSGFTIFLSPIPGRPMAPLYRMYYGVQFNGDKTETDMGYRYLTTNPDEARILEGLGPADKRAQRDGTYFRELGVNNGTGITGYIDTTRQPGTTEIRQVYRRDEVDKPSRLGGTQTRTTPKRQEIGDHVYTTKSAFEMSSTGTWQQEASRGFVRELTPYAGETSVTVLSERNQFESSHTVPVVVGATTGTRTLRFEIDMFIDRTSTSSAVEDTLLVSLVSASSTSTTLLDRGQAGTTLFAYSGGQADYPPGLVRFNGRTVEIDVSQVKVKGATAGRLLFQLLNHDTDLGTLFAIHPVQNLVDAGGVAASAFTAEQHTASVGGALNLAGLSRAAGLHAQIDNIRFNETTGQYQADLAVENHGAATGGNVVALFSGLPAGVTLLNRSGTNASGTPYLNLHDAIPGGGLLSRTKSQVVPLVFSNPNRVRFPISPTLLAGPTNRAPVLAAVGSLSVMPGGVLKVPLSATDPDGDPLTLSLKPTGKTRTLPAGEMRADGTLVFRPAPGELGTYQFNIVASDGALQTTRPATLRVTADPITTTRISGALQKTNGQPLAGVRIEVGAVQGLTASDGSFRLDLGRGALISDTIKIRAELLAGSAKYPFIAEKLPLLLLHDVYPGVNNLIERPIFLPALDLANAKTINPSVDTNVTTAALPGVSVLVKAGTLMNQQGTPYTGKLSITEVPVGLTPAALPDGLLPDLVVTIQPGEMVFAAPAPMTFPNRAGWAPGTLMDLWSINPVTGQFDDVGDMRVSANGASVQTISGGVRNSSWHFVSPPDPPLPDGASNIEDGDNGVGGPPNQPDSNPRNPDDGCTKCRAAKRLTSQVELHSGAVIETHALAGYQSQGMDRGLSLTYDSLRADPRPIVHMVLTTGIKGTIPTPDDKIRFVTELRMLEVPYEAPIGVGDLAGLNGEENFWTYVDTKRIDVALQADLSNEPSGVYRYRTRTGFLRPSGGFYTGTLQAAYSSLISVNAINSPFGAGWGLSGLQSLVVTKNGSVLLIDGDGSEVFYQRDRITGNFFSPPGNFSKLEKIFNLYRLTTPEQTVYQFNLDKQIESITDRVGNKTNYKYLDRKLTSIVDPVGLTTTFTYTGARVTTITDPAGRQTLLAYDSRGNLTSVTDPDAAQRNWEYDGLHHMTAEVDQLNRREETEYGFHGRAIKATRKDGSTVQLHPTQIDALLPPERTKDRRNPPSAFVLGPAETPYTEGNGNVIRTRLDRLGQVTVQRDSLGNLPSTVRNDQNLVTVSTDARGNSLSYEYDARGNVVKIDEFGGAALNGGINREGDRSVYTFMGRLGQQLLFDGLDVPRFGLDAILRAPDGRTVQTFNTGEPAPNLTPPLVTLTQAGEYKLEVAAGAARSTGAFGFRLLDVARAPKLELGKPLQFANNPPNSSEVFQLQGRAGQRLEFRLLTPLNDDPDQPFTIVGADFYGPGGTVTKVYQEQTVTLTVDGIYTVGISAGRSDFVSVGKFNVQLNDVSVTTTPTPATGFGTLYNGRLQPGEQRSFQFSGPAGLPIYFDNQLVADTQVQIVLRNAAGDIVMENGVGVQISGFYATILPATGRYTILLQNPATATAPLPYRFRLLNLNADASELSVGTPLTGRLDKPFQTNAYRFTASPGQHLYLHHPYDSSAVPTAVRYGTHELNNLDSPFTAPEAGTYYVFLENRTAAAAPYTLELIDVSTVPPLPLDTEVTGHVDPGGRPVFYQLDGTAGQRLYFDDLGTSGGGEGRFFRPDVVSDSLQAAFLLGGDRELSIPESGVNVVKLFTGVAATDFRFRLQTDPSSQANTTALTLGQTTAGSIDQPLEFDTFTFNGNVGQRLYYDGLGSDNTIIATLKDPTGRDLFSINAQYNFPAQNNRGPLTLTLAGTYRLVFTRASNQTGAYKFRLLDPETAPAIQLATPTTGTLEPGKGFKVWRLNVTAGQQLEFHHLGGNTVTSWTVLSPENNVLRGGIPFANGSSDALVAFGTSGTCLLISDQEVSAGGASVAYGFQVNDVTKTPVAASGLGTLHSGLLDPSETQSFMFTAPAGTLLYYDEQDYFDPQRDTQESRITIKVTDPAGGVVYQLADAYGTVAPTTLQHSGKYTVTLKNNDVSERNDYNFRLLDLRANAHPLNLGEPVAGTLAVGKTTDVYRFAATPGQRLYLDNLLVASNPDTELYGPDGTNLTGGIISNNFVIQAAGEYYLMVNNGTITSSTRYKVRILDLDQAPVLTIGSATSGTFGGGGEDPAVIFQFNATAGQQFVFDDLTDVRGLLSNGSGWRWLDANLVGVPLGSAADTLKTAPSDGTYFLEHDGSDGTSRPYGFRVATPETITTPISFGDAIAKKQFFTYDPKFSQLTSHTDELGKLTLRDIDPATGNTRSNTQVVGTVGGNDDLVTVFTHTRQGQVDVVTDPMGHRMDYDYDPRGRLISITASKGLAGQAIQRMEYDSEGNVSATIDERGHRTEYRYDPRNRLKQVKDALGNVSKFDYDRVGNLIFLTDARGNVTSAEYDSRDRLKRIIDAKGGVTSYEYDESGNVKSVSDPLGQVTQFEYDLRNRRTKSIDPQGNVTTFGYDLDNNLTSITDALDNQTVYTLDARGRVVKETDSLGQVTSYEYDAVDNLVAKVDRLSRRSEFVYDDLHRLTTETWVGANPAHVVQYDYDTMGMLMSVSDPAGTFAFMYDDRDRVSQIMEDRPAGAPDSILVYTFDTAGNELSVRDTINGVVGGTNAYVYDALNRMSRITQSGPGIAPKRVNLTYNPVGQFARIDRFADTAGVSRVATSSYTYDTLNRLTNIAHKNSAGASLDFFSFAYDAASRIPLLTDVDGQTNYTYDLRDQLIGASHADAANPDESYAYDATGNRASSHRHGSGYVVGDGVASTKDNNRLSSDGTFRYAYDAEGNLVKRTHISSGAVREFTWDYRNRLASVTDRPRAGGAATQVVTYTYDALNRRIAKHVDTTPGNGKDGRVTHFVYDADDVLVELTDPDGSGPQPAIESSRLLHGPAVDQVFAMEDFAGNVLWPLTDQLGTVHDLVNNSGAVVNHIKYDSYGNVISQTNPAIDTRYQYTGREFDAETGLQFNRARYYDASTGRFISEDPIGFSGGDNNLYRYVENRPNVATDPSGLAGRKNNNKSGVYSNDAWHGSPAEKLATQKRNEIAAMDRAAAKTSAETTVKLARDETAKKITNNLSKKRLWAVCPRALGALPDALELATDVYDFGPEAGLDRFMRDQIEKATHDPILGEYFNSITPGPI